MFNKEASPFLYIGTTFAIFMASGIIPFIIDELKIKVSGYIMPCLEFLIICELIPSMSELALGLRLSIMRETSLVVTGDKKRL